MGGTARREKRGEPVPRPAETLNGVLPGCPGVRGRFVRTVDDWLIVDEYPAGSENDQIVWLLIRIARSKFLGLRGRTGYLSVSCQT
jgi:hypothetical protein